MALSIKDEETERARRLALTRETQARIAALPILDNRSPDEPLDYDENGLHA